MPVLRDFVNLYAESDLSETYVKYKHDPREISSYCLCCGEAILITKLLKFECPVRD